MPRYMKLLASLLAVVLFPFVSPAYAVSASSEAYLTTLTVNGVSPTSLKGNVFGRYDSKYFYTAQSTDFGSISLTWTQSANSLVEVGIRSVPQLRDAGGFLSGSTLALDDDLFCTTLSNPCPDSDKAGFSTIEIKVTAQDNTTIQWYYIYVVRPLPGDSNVTFTPSAANAQTNIGEVPDPITGPRGFYETPDEGSLYRNGYGLKGWTNPLTDEVMRTGEYFYLGESFSSDPVWVEDVVDLDIEIEDLEPININSASETNQYYSFTSTDTQKIQFSVTTDARYQIALYKYSKTDPNQIYDAIDSLDTDKSFLSIDCNQGDDPSCTPIFRLQLIAHYPSGNQAPKSVNIYLIRLQPNATSSPVRITWPDKNSDNSDDDIDTNVTGGWYQLPQTTPPDRGFLDIDHVAGYTMNVYDDNDNVIDELEYVPGERVPVIYDQTFYANVVRYDISPVMDFYGVRYNFIYTQNMENYCLDGPGIICQAPVSGQFYGAVPNPDFWGPALLASWPVIDGTYFGGGLAFQTIEVDSGCGGPSYWDCTVWPVVMSAQTSSPAPSFEFQYTANFILEINANYTLKISDPHCDASEQVLARGWYDLPDPDSLNCNYADHFLAGWEFVGSSMTAQQVADIGRIPLVTDIEVQGIWEDSIVIELKSPDGQTTNDTEEFQAPVTLGAAGIIARDSDYDYDFLGWSLEPYGEILTNDYLLSVSTVLYAIVDSPFQFISPSFSVFGADFEIKNCLFPDDEDICIYEGNPQTPVLGFGNEFVTVVSTDLDFSDPLDDVNQRVTLDWNSFFSGHALEITAEDFYSSDFRIPEAIHDFYFDLDDQNEFSDDELCPAGAPNDMCHQLFTLEYAYTYTSAGETADYNFTIHFIVENGSPGTYSVAFDPLAQTDAYSGRSTWIDWPEDLQDTQVAHFVGWTSNSVNDGDPLVLSSRLPMFPVLQNEEIRPVWLPYYLVSFYRGDSLLGEVQTYGAGTYGQTITAFYSNSGFDPTAGGFLHWSLTPGGSAISSSAEHLSATTLYAVYQGNGQQNDQVSNVPNQGSNNPAPPNPVVPSNPATGGNSSSPDSNWKTRVFIDYANGITTIKAYVPAKYANKTARLEIKRIIRGKVRYYLIGKTGTALENNKAVMIFRVKLRIKTVDFFRIKINGIQVIRSTGDGKPAWK